MTKNVISKLAATCAAVAVISACSYEDENMAEKRARQFAQDYFNLRYVEAARYCTEESVRWVKYRASNITQSDLDVLNSQSDTATCEVDDISYDDTSANVKMVVKNFLSCDSIGKNGVMCKERQFMLPMIKKGDSWFVQLDRML